MTQPEQSPQVFEGVDVEVDPTELETEEDEQLPSSDAEGFREEGDTQGGTGGLDAGGAG